MRIFRYEGDMTGTEYNRAIVQHLSHSEKLIVVCSPRARASKYVDDEIRRFVEVSDAGNIIPVLLEGIPNNVAEVGQEELMAFPEALCEALDMPLATSYLGYGIQKARVNKGFFESAWYALLVPWQTSALIKSHSLVWKNGKHPAMSAPQRSTVNWHN